MNLIPHFDHALNVYRYHLAQPAREFSDSAWAKRWLQRCVRDEYITADEALEIRKECKEILI